MPAVADWDSAVRSTMLRADSRGWVLWSAALQQGTGVDMTGWLAGERSGL